MKQELIKIKNSKNQNIATVIHRPEFNGDKLAILCPGYLDTKDYAHLIGLANALCSRGYTVVRFDPTGTWESDGDISEYDITQYLSDIRSIIDHMLIEKKYDHIIIGGHSRGAQVSLLYAARDFRITSVIAIMPSSNSFYGKHVDEWKQAGFRIFSRDIPNSIARKEFKVPYSHVLDGEKYDVLKDIKNIHVPIIFIAGELDSVVLPEDVRGLFESANEPKKFVFLKAIDHDYRFNQEEIEEVNAEAIKNL